ncbi:MAG: hypothetical protein KME17_14775 [Cyanosarcina radialis HA8281-LM2]|jgi:hypothetical protein|nr:hypothetical protein [Cyanosarcina radialis HA8281-LM2]
MNSLLQSFSLKALEMLEVYEYYNQPILFSCRNSFGELFLGFWVDETENGEVWFYLPMSWQRLQEVRTGIIDLRNAFLHSEYDVILEVKTTNNNADEIVTTIPSQQIDINLLPMAGESLKLNAETLKVYN